MRKKLKHIASHPAINEALKSLKPKKNFWGIFSVLILFILPEIIAFIWGSDITAFCETHIAHLTTYQQQAPYQALQMLFGEGSWINLILGFGLLTWLFF